MRILARLGLTLPLALLATTARPATGQDRPSSSHRWQLTLDDQRYLWDVRLVRLAGDTLITQERDSLVGTPVARIAEMRLLPETILRVGDGHESAISALAGSNPDVYDLTQLDQAGRRSTIQKILSLEATPHEAGPHN
jgi:hypothetical protein